MGAWGCGVKGGSRAGVTGRGGGRGRRSGGRDGARTRNGRGSEGDEWSRGAKRLPNERHARIYPNSASQPPRCTRPTSASIPLSPSPSLPTTHMPPRIFTHAPSSNSKLIFGQGGAAGDRPPVGERWALDPADARVRRVPFVTRRPTFSELRRVVMLLGSVMQPAAGVGQGEAAGEGAGVEVGEDAGREEVREQKQAEKDGEVQVVEAEQQQQQQEEGGVGAGGSGGDQAGAEAAAAAAAAAGGDGGSPAGASRKKGVSLDGVREEYPLTPTPGLTHRDVMPYCVHAAPPISSRPLCSVLGDYPSNTNLP